MAKILMTLCFAVMSAMPAFAQEQVENFTAKLFKSKGTVEVMKKDGAWTAVRAPFMLDAGDQVKTGPKSRAEIYIKYGSKVRLDADTTFEIAKVAPEENSVSVMKGKMHAWIRKFAGRSFSVRTPAAVCAVRGTVFGVAVAESGAATWDLFNGAIQVSDPRAGYFVDLKPGQRLLMSPEPAATPPTPEPIPVSVKPPSEPAKIAEEKVEIKAEQIIIEQKAKEAAAVVAPAPVEEPKAEEPKAEEPAAEEVVVPVVQEPATTVIPTETVQESQEVSGSNP